MSEQSSPKSHTTTWIAGVVVSIVAVGILYLLSVPIVVRASRTTSIPVAGSYHVFCLSGGDNPVQVPAWADTYSRPYERLCQWPSLWMPLRRYAKLWLGDVVRIPVSR